MASSPVKSPSSNSTNSQTPPAPTNASSSSSSSPSPLSSPPPQPSSSFPPTDSPPSPPFSDVPPPPAPSPTSPPPSVVSPPSPPSLAGLPPSPPSGSAAKPSPTHSKGRPPPPPPPPHRRSGGNEGQGMHLSAIIGIAVGIGAFFMILIIASLCCCTTAKKKRKRPHDPMHYYADPSGRKGGSDYYSSSVGGAGQRPNWGPPPPGAYIMNVAPPPPPPQMNHSNNTSSTYSGPHGPVLPPPMPNLALGFNKSTFTYDELAAATGGFSQANLLGQGGFGYVYKGVLPNGKEVAVKQLKSGSGQGEREFQAEVEIISRVHHRHLVSLVGKGRPTMDWATRLKIALGSAKGLAYLHEDCESSARPNLTRALNGGNYEELVDPRLGDNYNPSEMTRLVAIAATSVRHSARKRPKMSQIVRALEGDVSLEDLNEGVKPGNSTFFGSNASSDDNDTSSQNSNMRKIRKVALSSQESNSSSEYGVTSEYGLHPSSSSSEAGHSREMETSEQRRSPLSTHH
ncbi:Proline-rich receptor-like protein kinase PERK4 [Acorus gramineus]|uniref:non-specific serine/threonine protein kinase n=1 Tax=Acorus gramineus TaxID=55184 RepID=A0AAV9AYA1_ACOGR|nr:Proline-rich receptor-like protein kinase PERK4 [Acorus gramineus]